MNCLQRYVQPQLMKVPINRLEHDLIKNFHKIKKFLTNTFINFKGVISISANFQIGINMTGYFL